MKKVSGNIITIILNTYLHKLNLWETLDRFKINRKSRLVYLNFVQNFYGFICVSLPIRNLVKMTQNQENCRKIDSAF